MTLSLGVARRYLCLIAGAGSVGKISPKESRYQCHKLIRSIVSIIIMAMIHVLPLSGDEISQLSAVPMVTRKVLAWVREFVTAMAWD